jgi:hypothetical protein
LHQIALNWKKKTQKKTQTFLAPWFNLVIDFNGFFVNPGTQQANISPPCSSLTRIAHGVEFAGN